MKTALCHTDTRRPCDARHRLERRCCKPTNAEAAGTRREPGGRAPGFRTVSLQNGEGVALVSGDQPVCATLVWQPWDALTGTAKGGDSDPRLRAAHPAFPSALPARLSSPLAAPPRGRLAGPRWPPPLLPGHGATSHGSRRPRPTKLVSPRLQEALPTSLDTSLQQIPFPWPVISIIGEEKI